MRILRRILSIILFSLLFVSPVSANVVTKERLEEENYGVKKDFKVTSSNLDDIKSTPYVDPELGIYDEANILEDAEEQTLSGLIKNFREKMKMDIVIYTYSKNVSYERNKFIGSNFYDYNDFGMKFDEHYSGILLVRNAHSSKTYFEILSFGNAQFYFNKSRIDNILDQIESNMFSKNYFDAFKSFISFSQAYIEEGKWSGYQKYFLDDDHNLLKKYSIPFLGVFIASSIITALIIYIFIKKNKMVVKATNARQYIDVENMDINVRQQHLTSSNTSTYVISSNSSSSGRGKGSSGGSFTSSGRRG